MVEKIEITKQDIEQGKSYLKNKCLPCMLELAITRQMKTGFSVGYLFAWNKQTYDLWLIPRPVIDKIVQFDRGEIIEPFSFELRKA